MDIIKLLNGSIDGSNLHKTNPEVKLDIIKWDGQLFMKSKIISGGHIGVKFKQY
jgi:hypothetical protein